MKAAAAAASAPHLLSCACFRLWLNISPLLRTASATPPAAFASPEVSRKQSVVGAVVDPNPSGSGSTLTPAVKEPDPQ